MGRSRFFRGAVVAALAVGLAPFAFADDPKGNATTIDAPVEKAADETSGKTAESSAPAPIRFRRIFAPADRVQDWPRGRVRYVPVDGEEFERLIKAAQDQPGGAAGVLAAAVVRAEYSADFDGVDTLTGSARCEIRHSTRSRAVLPLAPFGFALRRAWWRSEKEPNVRKPVELGTGADGTLALAVDESGELGFEWSLRGERDADGRVSFALQTPRCAASEMTVSAPRGFLITASHGLIVPQAAAAAPPAGPLPIVPKRSDNTLRDTMRILLSGKQATVLRLSPQGASADAQPRAVLRENVIYDVSPRGVDVTATWKLDVQGAPLRQLHVTLDPGLQLVSARLGETDVPWSAGPHADGEPTTLFLTLPEPISGADRSLRLAAIGSIELGSPCNLPRIRAADAFWQEGTHTLIVREPLEVTSLKPTDCRQTKYTLLPDPNRGEAFELQLFSPTAEVQLSLARKQRLPSLSSGTTIELGPDEARAVLGVAIDATSAAPTSLVADVLPGWTVDAVESRPTDALSDWRIQSGVAGEELSLRFSKTKDTERRAILFVRAHRHSRDSSAAGKHSRFQAEELIPLRFHEAQLGESLLALRSQEGFDARIVEAQSLARLDFARLTEDQSALFVDPAPSVVYRYDPRRTRFAAFAQPQRPRYTAEIQSAALVETDGVAESYKLRVTPDGTRVAKLLVQFSQAREAPLRWRLTSEGPAAVIARRLTDAERGAADAPQAPEAWELTLSTPRSAAFELVASRRSPLDGALPVSLATLPDATGGQARLTIKGAANEALAISNQGLKPVEMADDVDGSRAPDSSSRARANFEYGAGSGAGVVTVARAAGGLATPNALVWRREIQSWEDAAGHGAHMATFRIQNSGRDAVLISLDASAKPDRVWCDGDAVPTEWSAGRSEEPSGSVKLPADREFVTVVVEFNTTREAGGFLSRIETPRVDIDAPVLQTEWTLRLPPGNELLRIAGGSCDQAPSELTWSQRLFGPLGRSLQTRPLDPLSLGDSTEAVAAAQSAASTAKSTPDRWPQSTPVAALRDAGAAKAYLIRVDGSAAVAQLARRSSMAAFGLAIFACSLAAGMYAVCYGRRSVVALLFLTAALALITPRAFSPLATGALWGIALSLAWSFARQAFKAPVRRDTPSTSGSVSGARLLAASRHALPILLAAGWFALADPLALAQPKATNKNNDGPLVHRVFIPVDEDERPTKDKYQVPQELHDELRRRAGDLAGSTQSFAIESARYQLAVNRDAATGALAAGDVLAQYEVNVLRPRAEIRLPLVGVRPGPVARRDDQVVDFAWETFDEGITCHFDEAGTYKLEFVLRPARGDFGPGALDISIPRVARATLEVQLPTDPPSIDVPVAVGAVKSTSEGRKVSAELGPAERLTVIWNKPRATAAAQTIDVDAWLWMQLQPGSVTLQAHLDVKPQRTAPVKELRLTVDPRLRPLPLGAAPGLITSVEPLPMDPRTIRVELARAITEPTTLRLSFLLTGSSGVGQLQLPQLAPAGGKFAQRVLAVSVDPALEYETPKIDAELAVAIPEFLAHWGESATLPQLVTRLAADQLWTIHTRPRASRDVARQTLSVSADETQALVRFEAQLTAADERATTAGFTCRHRLRVPPELQVDSVSLLQDGVERVSRFSREATGDLTVILASPVFGPQHLALNGWLPVKQPGPLRLPRIELLSVERRETMVVIYRQPAVHVSIEGLQSLTATPLPPGPLPLGVAAAPIAGRAVAAFTAQTDEYGALLVISNNRPRVQSTVISSVSQESGAWQGRVEYRCVVTDGSLDVIRFKLPPEWTGPFETTPSGATATIETQEDERRLVVRPKAAIEGEYRFTARGPLRDAFVERFAFPTLIAGPQEESAAFVLLPVNVRNQHVAWQVVGLRPERLPDETAPSALVQAHENYRLLEPTASARLLHRGAPGGETRITRCDVQLAWSDDAPARGVARFEVEPVGQTECALSVPESAEILELRVAGLVVTALAAADGWRVPLDGSAATQTIEVAFACQQAHRSLLGDVELAAPAIVGPKIERTSWTIFAPNAAGVGELADADAYNLVVEPSAATREAPAHFSCGRDDHWEIVGPAPTIRVRYPQNRPLANLGRWTCAFALVAVGLTAGFARGPFAAGRASPRSAFEWRPLVALVTSVAAWIWIRPAWIGMALAGAALLAWAWPALRAARAASQSGAQARNDA